MKLYKYKPFNLHALHLLVRDELYLAGADKELNDPVDCALIYKGEVRPFHATVCSLSEVKDQFAMWSQYAAGHRGLCFELDEQAIRNAVEEVNSIVAERKLVLFERVQYLRPARFKDAVADAIVEEVGNLVVDQKSMIFVKTDTFSHEREVRLAMKSTDARKTLTVPKVVKAVYLGINMPRSDASLLAGIVEMMNSTQSRNIGLYRSVGIDDRYRVNFDPVAPAELALESCGEIVGPRA